MVEPTVPAPAAAPPASPAASAGPTVQAPVAAPTTAPEAEPAAWAEVEARWGDPAAHRAYLDRFRDLDGLTAAGRRYRAVLEARPGDPVALAMKGEILKRATVVGLAMLPRTAPPRTAPGTWKRRALLMLAAWLASATAYLAWKLFVGPLP